MRRETYIFALLTLLLLLAFAACREDELVVPTEYEIIGDEASGSPVRDSILSMRAIWVQTSAALIITTITQGFIRAISIPRKIRQW